MNNSFDDNKIITNKELTNGICIYIQKCLP